jgi:hypothetical protein
LNHVRKVTAIEYEETIRRIGKLVDINDAEKVRTVICTSSVSEGRKELLANAYDHYCNFKGLTWIKPQFTREDKSIFLPLESELDALISNARLKIH